MIAHHERPYKPTVITGASKSLTDPESNMKHIVLLMLVRNENALDHSINILRLNQHISTENGRR